MNTREVLRSNSNPTQDQLSETATELRSLIRNLHRIESEIDRTLYESTRTAIEAVINGVERLESRASTRRSAANMANQLCPRLPRRPDEYGVPITRGGRRSDIDRSKLEAFLGMGFTVTYIANHGLLGGNVHRNTIHNFIRRNGICGPRQRYSAISDADLREKIAELNRRYPNSGAQEMLSLLRSHTPSLIVQRDRCRRILAEIDPVGTARRWSQAIRRRQYSVPTPNSLWHLDSNHSLIRYVKQFSATNAKYACKQRSQPFEELYLLKKQEIANNTPKNHFENFCWLPNE